MNSETTLDRRSLRARFLRKVRKEEILRAAQKVISTQGYEATSIDAVIEAAGVSRGTFYLYFKSRDALFYELIDGFIEKLMGSIERVHVENGSPVKDLYSNLKRVVDILFENRHLTVILLREAVAFDRRVDQKLSELNDFVNRMVVGALRNGAKLNLIRKVDEPIVAMAIIGSIKEVLYQYLVAGKEPLPDPETVARGLLDFGMNGLKVESTAG